MLDRDSRLSNWRIVIVAALMMAIGGAYPFAASLEKALFPTLAEGETVMRDLVRGPEIVCVVWSRHKLRAAKIENAGLNIERRDGYISYGGALTPAPGGIVYLAPHISAPRGPYGHDTVICANMAYSAVAQREAATATLRIYYRQKWGEWIIPWIGKSVDFWSPWETRYDMPPIDIPPYVAP